MATNAQIAAAAIAKAKAAKAPYALSTDASTMGTVTDLNGNKVQVYISGPNAGYDINHHLIMLPNGKVVGSVPADTSTPMKLVDTPGTPGVKNSTPLTKKAISTNTVTRNGHQIIITTFDDGTQSEQDYGLSAGSAMQQTNWLETGKALLEQYGVGSLWNDYNDLITNKGYDNATAMLALQSTKAWMDRFSANKTRLEQGLAVLDPATYLATEEKYKDVMISAGIDKSIYSDTTKLGELIAKDVSPVEAQYRLDAARFELNNQDAFVTQQLKDRFGLTEGDIILHMLDPKIAASVIAFKVQSAKINAEAARQNFAASQLQSDVLAAQGVTQAEAAAGFTDLGQMGQYAQALPGTDVSGSLTNQQMIDAQFKSNAAALTTREKVKATRTAEFQAGGGVAATAAGVVGAGANLAT